MSVLLNWQISLSFDSPDYFYSTIILYKCQEDAKNDVKIITLRLIPGAESADLKTDILKILLLY